MSKILTDKEIKQMQDSINKMSYFYTLTLKNEHMYTNSSYGNSQYYNSLNNNEIDPNNLAGSLKRIIDSLNTLNANLTSSIQNINTRLSNIENRKDMLVGVLSGVDNE